MSHGGGIAKVCGVALWRRESAREGFSKHKSASIAKSSRESANKNGKEKICGGGYIVGEWEGNKSQESQNSGRTHKVFSIFAISPIKRERARRFSAATRLCAPCRPLARWTCPSVMGVFNLLI